MKTVAAAWAPGAWCCLVALGMLAGCRGPSSTSDAYAAYEAGRFRDAYSGASRIAENSSGAQRDEAAYIAGLSAQKLEDPEAARRYLGMAGRSADPKLAGDALAALGMVHSEQGRYAAAARAFLEAAPHLNGEDRARAHFYAAAAYQKLGRHSEAWTYFTLAAGETQEASFRRRIERERATTGWTIQTGAFEVEQHARKALARASRAAAGKPWGTARLVQARRADGNALLLVQIGQFSSFMTAERARRRLGLNGARCVPAAPAR